MTRVQADIVPAVVDWLGVHSVGAAVRQNVPDKWSPAAGPVLVVADDGGPTLLPIKSEHTLRLTAYAPGRTQARAVVALAAGKLVESNPRPSGVAHIDPEMSGILDARDKETGAMLASVLITAHARTVEV